MAVELDTRSDEIDRFITALFSLYETKASTLYDPGVTQLQHALQCARLAVDEGAPDVEVLASLLHDVGHLVVGEHDARPDFLSHDLRHENAGAEWLAGFGADVAEPVRQHVAAKRYLTSVDRGYWDSLSTASKRSLEIQGGAMSRAEAQAFASLPAAQAAIALRRRDDRAKRVGLSVPDLRTYRSMIDRQLRHRATIVTPGP